jgi:hypothetical protein
MLGRNREAAASLRNAGHIIDMIAQRDEEIEEEL